MYVCHPEVGAVVPFVDKAYLYVFEVLSPEPPVSSDTVIVIFFPGESSVLLAVVTFPLASNLETTVVDTNIILDKGKLLIFLDQVTPEYYYKDFNYKFFIRSLTGETYEKLVSFLKDAVSDGKTEEILGLVDRIEEKFLERNEKCKLLK